MLTSNPSAVVIQWHGRRHRRGGVALLFFYYHAIGLKRKMSGVWGQSPQGIVT